jgi:hypothetical protein
MSVIFNVAGTLPKIRKKKKIGSSRWGLPKYKANLKVDDSYVYSYDTKVAKINHRDKTITPLGYWSTTTSKHINYVGSEYGYKVNKK